MWTLGVSRMSWHCCLRGWGGGWWWLSLYQDISEWVGVRILQMYLKIGIGIFDNWEILTFYQKVQDMWQVLRMSWRCHFRGKDDARVKARCAGTERIKGCSLYRAEPRGWGLRVYRTVTAPLTQLPLCRNPTRCNAMCPICCTPAMRLHIVINAVLSNQLCADAAFEKCQLEVCVCDSHDWHICYPPFLRCVT